MIEILPSPVKARNAGLKGSRGGRANSLNGAESERDASFDIGPTVSSLTRKVGSIVELIESLSAPCRVHWTSCDGSKKRSNRSWPRFDA